MIALYNTAQYNRARYGVGSPERPAEHGAPARPVRRLGLSDPLLSLRPDADWLRDIVRARRRLDRHLR